MRYLTRPYAPAWGILIGAAIGIPFGGYLIAMGSLIGLIIGSLISQMGKEKTTLPPASSSCPMEKKDESFSESSLTNTERRLKELEKLKAKSMISEEEYQLKRKQILDGL